MKRSMVVLVAGVVTGVIGTAAFGVVGTSHAAAGTHHTSYTYLLKPGQSRSFNVPGAVTRIEVSAMFEGKPAQTPKSQVMFATVGYDGNTHHLSWIGTSSDGSQRAANELSSKTVARICGTTCGFMLSKLAITQGPDRMTLVLAKRSGTSADFTVNLWY
jgi:hypothetical protein